MDELTNAINDAIEDKLSEKLDDKISEEVGKKIAETPTTVEQTIVEVVPEQLESVRDEIAQAEEHTESLQEQVTWLRNELVLMRATLELLIPKAPLEPMMMETPLPETETITETITVNPEAMDSSETKTEASEKSAEEKPAKPLRAKVILV